MMKDCKNLQEMIQKLEDLKDKIYDEIYCREKMEIDDLLIYNTQLYINIDHKNTLYVDYDKYGIVQNAYLDCENINTFPVFYLYFPPGTRWDDLLMDNFYIRIRSSNIKMALYCLHTISPIKFKKVFVTSKTPTNLRPIRSINSSYREQQHLNPKFRNSILNNIDKMKIIKEINL